jgi:hypothetical protein
MTTLFLILLLANLIGVIVCNSIAKSRGSRHVVFWTIMGVIFGPFAIPFVLRFTRPADHETNAPAA